jgi:hypothetical protein
MNTAILSAVSALAGSTIGAVASIATTWLTQYFQGRVQRASQDNARREHLFSDFINQASKLYVDALTHDLIDPSTLVPLYALKSQIYLFAAEETAKRAEEVLRHITETYYKPNRNFRTPQSGEEGEYDLLHDFTLACRAELVD